jgi:hypothetical protein
MDAIARAPCDAAASPERTLVPRAIFRRNRDRNGLAGLEIPADRGTRQRISENGWNRCAFPDLPAIVRVIAGCAIFPLAIPAGPGRWTAASMQPLATVVSVSALMRPFKRESSAA